MSRTTRRQEYGVARIRKFSEADADELGRIMHDAIRTGRSKYTEAQRRAWQEYPPSGAGWLKRLKGQHVWVAEDDDGPLGFLSLDAKGYIDLAFVRSRAQGMGVFSGLYAALEARAMSMSLPRLRTHASLMAQPAFEAQGFHVIRHETVARLGEELARAEMGKNLK